MTRRAPDSDGATGAAAAPPWSAPFAVASLPADGAKVVLVADAASTQAVREAGGLRSLEALRAEFELQPRGRGGVTVRGLVRASVGQECVVTLDPIETAIDEPIELTFLPAREIETKADGDDADAMLSTSGDDHDPPEAFDGDTIDLGAIAAEFLLLALDPYPRKPGVAFESAAADDEPTHRPFAGLAALKAKLGGDTP